MDDLAGSAAALRVHEHARRAAGAERAQHPVPADPVGSRPAELLHGPAAPTRAVLPAPAGRRATGRQYAVAR